LAKPYSATGQAGASVLPTAGADLTAQGTILGTLQYMSPEQLQGEEADARTDIFAFGAVLYEMVTGKKAFEGKNQASLIGAILHVDPPEISTFRQMTPPALDHVVRRCLTKNPDDRWQSANDLRGELQWINEAGSQTNLTVSVPKDRSRREVLAWTLMSVAVVSLATMLVFRSSKSVEDVSPVRFSVEAPAGASFEVGGPISPFPAISPDGKYLAFEATEGGKEQEIWIRSLDTLEAHPLPGTEKAFLPFWSPDSRYVGFTADNKLKKADLSGGLVQVIAALPPGFAPEGGSVQTAQAEAAWNKDGTILFNSQLSGLMRVSSTGEIAPVTSLDSSLKETIHRNPSFLPDGQHFLYLAQPGNVIYLGSLDSKERKRLLTADSRAVYAAPGFLLFVRQGTLLAQRFDLKKLEPFGEPFAIAEGVRFNSFNGRSAFSVSDTGTLVYRTGTGGTFFHAIWVDRTGKRDDTIVQAGNNVRPSLSPDGSRLIVERGRSTERIGRDLWLIDLVRGTNTRFTFDEGHDDTSPIWSPDGSRITFMSDKDGSYSLYEKPSSGTGEEKPLLKLDKDQTLTGVFDWSMDGRTVAYTSRSNSRGNNAIWTFSPTEAKPQVFLKTTFNEDEPYFSPDGHWIAYMSDESGSYQIYVRPFPPGEGKWQVSLDGGIQPRWRSDGKELFFLERSKLMAVDVKMGPASAGKPRMLFENPGMANLNVNSANPAAAYGIAPDGQRFVFSVRPAEDGPSPLTVVLHWPSGLKR
jgi:Tol biopolymer transport system component